MKNKISYSYIIYGLMYVAIFAFVGVFNFSVARFDSNVLQDPAYWISTATTSLTYVFAFQVSVWLSADVMTNTDEQYLEITEDIRKFARTKIRGDFDVFIEDEINWKNKIEAWKTTQKNKLIRWQNKMPAKVLEDSRHPKTQWKPRTKRYFEKRDKIERLITDEWINENLPYKRISYPRITPQEVITGEEKPVSNKKLIDSNISTYALGKRFVMLGITVMFNAIFSTMFLEGKIFNVAFLATVLFQLTMIGVNIATGWASGVDGFRKKRLTSARTRYDILLQYASWDGNSSRRIENDTAHTATSS